MRIALVCLGNICRSPMADVVLEERLRAAGLDVQVVSAGTAGYHIGSPMDRRAAATLKAAGYDPSRHRAKRFESSWFDDCDLVLAMDDANFDELTRAAGPHRDKVRMFRDYDPTGTRRRARPVLRRRRRFPHRARDRRAHRRRDRLRPPGGVEIMARMGTIAGRAEALLDTSVVATSPVAGGDICVATRLRLSDGSSAIMKTRAHAPADFFRAEALGLAWLAEANGVPTPAVLAVEDDCLILEYVEPGRATNDAAESFGRALATTHAAGAETFGSNGGDGYIGSLPMPNRPAPPGPSSSRRGGCCPISSWPSTEAGCSPTTPRRSTASCAASPSWPVRVSRRAASTATSGRAT